MKKNFNRGISLLLTVCLVLGIFASSGITLVRAESATTPETTVDTVVSGPKNQIANGTFGFMQEIVYSYPVDNNSIVSPWVLGGSASTGVQTIITNENANDGQWSFKFVVDSKKAEGKDRSLRFDIVLKNALAEDTLFNVSFDSLVSGYQASAFFNGYKGSVDSKNKAGGANMTANVSTTWTTNAKTIKIEAGATIIRFQITAEADYDATIYLDNFKIAYASNPDVNLIETNASFENDRPSSVPTITNDVLVLKDKGWVPGGVSGTKDYGEVAVMADPADFLNGVLAIEDTKAATYNEDGSYALDDKGKELKGGYPTAYYGPVSIEAGASYTFTLKYKLAKGSENLTGTAYLRGNKHDSGGTDLAKNKGALNKGKTDDWTLLKVEISDIPTGIETFYVMLATSSPLTGTMYIDDVTLTKNCAEHTWGEADVTDATCTEDGISVVTCTNCGATSTTVLRAPGHNIVNGTCSECGAACEHNAPEGYCTICGKELPANFPETGKGLFKNGSLQTNGVIDYPAHNLGNKIDGWYGIDGAGDGFLEEVIWEVVDGKETDNAVFHMNDTSTNATYNVAYYLYSLKKSTTYTLKFKAKRIGDDPMVTVTQLDSAGKGIGETVYGTSAGMRLKANQTSANWADYCYNFTTTDDDFFRVRLTVASGKDGITEAWYDNFSLVENCTHTWANPVVSEPDCCTGPIRTVTCSNCGATGTTEFGKPTEHAWDEGVFVPELSDSEDLVTLYTCTECGATKTVTTHANGHRYSAVVTEPTCETDGYTTYTCDCGDSYKDAIIKAPGHKYDNGKCTVCDSNHEFKLLLVGNSFSRDAADWGQKVDVSQLLGILQAMLGEHAEVTLGLVHQGSRGMNWHATQAYYNNAAYAFDVITTANPTWEKIASSSYTSADALAYTDWDIVTLQPYSYNGATGRESVPERYEKEIDVDRFGLLKDALAYMLDHVDKYAPTAEVYLYTHWVRAADTVLNASLSKYENEAATWPAALDVAGTNSGKTLKTIIPVNLSMQNARTTYLATLRYNIGSTGLNIYDDVQIGLQRDGGHLSINIGRYIAGLTFAEMLIPENVRAEGYVLPNIRDSVPAGKLPQEYTEIAQKSVLAAVNSWKNGSLAVTNIEGYEQDPTVAASATLKAMTLALDLGNADTYNEQIRTAVLAALPVDFAVDAIVVNAETNTASVTIRFGYTFTTVEMAIEYEQSCEHEYDNDCDADCNTCGAVRDAGHDYDDNCDVDCNVCGDFRTAPHNLGESVPAVIPANCQEIGHDEYWICADCDAYLMSDGNGGYYETNPAWINYNGEHVRPADAAACATVACELCGEDTYGDALCDRGEAPACQDATCINCGGTVYGEGHSYGYDEETWESLIPLCQAGDCIHCGEHLDYIYECENGSYAPCSVDGECSYGCGKLFPATGIHGLDDPCAGGLCWMCWEQIEGAHNYVDGACDVCGEKDPNASCGDNHSWNEGEVTVAAGKNTTGIMTYTCTACGEQKEEVIPPVLRFNGATLTLMSNVQVNFTVSRAILDEYGYTDLYAVFTYTNRDKQLITVTVTEYRLTDKYVFDFTELAPDLFGNTITATLYAKNNGKEYVSKTIEYSVLTYCNNKLEVYAAAVQKADLCFRTMLVDLLNYGAAAQLESGNNTDALVNAGLTEEQKSWGSTASGGYVSIQGAGEEVETPRATWKSASLLLEDAVTMVVTLEAADLEGLSVKVNCGKFEFTYDCVVDPEAEEQIFVPGEKENRYKLYINELPVYAMRDPVYITVYKDGEAASRQLTYSVESYVANKYGKVSESFDNMLDAMMRYGDAVNAYVTALGVK